MGGSRAGGARPRGGGLCRAGGLGPRAFGPELASNDPGSAYAAWVQGEADVYAQHTNNARGASVRLVYKARQLKDASEL